MESRLKKQLKPKNYRRCLLLLLTLLIPSFSSARDVPKIAIVLSANQTYYQRCANVIVETLKANQQKVAFHTRIYRLEDLKTAETQLDNPDLLVTIGSEAAAYGMTLDGSITLLNVLLPRQTYLDLLNSHRLTKRNNVSAIFIDQPPTRIVALAKSLPLNIEAIGAISSANNTETARNIGKILATEHIRFNYRGMMEQENPVQVLKPLFAESDAFIAIPDKAIFNRAMARWILSLSIRHKVPVIGFSSAYAEAGALVSIFSTPDNIGKHTGEWLIDQYRGLKRIDIAGEYPKYFTIQSNISIARAMNINGPRIDKQYLMEQVLVQEMSDEH